jgi:hypothetical protein
MQRRLEQVFATRNTIANSGQKNSSRRRDSKKRGALLLVSKAQQQLARDTL